MATVMKQRANKPNQATPANPRTQCPVNGCTCRKEINHVLCRSHWDMLSAVDRDRIQYLLAQQPGSDDLSMAVQAAIEEVEGKEGFSQVD